MMIEHMMPDVCVISSATRQKAYHLCDVLGVGLPP
jgi:hypothetical protein